jgi:SAM-dependent methyltransferase
MADDKTYWQQKHIKYLNEDFINKPTIFATQAIKYFPKTGKVLELGAGQGQDAIYFLEKGYDVTACDLSEFALKLAEKKIPESLKNKIEFKALDFSQTLPFEPNNFDVIFSHLALHYFNRVRTEKLFNEIYTILKPGGIFATLTNTTDDDETKRLAKIEGDYFINPEGLKKRYFSVDSMKKITDKFEILLLDAQGETYKDKIKTLIRFIGKK